MFATGCLSASLPLPCLAIFGELFNVRPLVDIGGTYGLTLGASVVTLLAAVGFALTARPRDTSLARLVESTPGGALLRRLIPLLLLPIAAGLVFATLVRSGFVSDSTAAWVVTLAAVTVVVATGWRAAESIDRLVDVRAVEHDRLHAIVDALPFVINVFDASGELSDEDLGSTRAPEAERRNLQPLVTAALSGRRQRLAWTDLSTGAPRHLEADGVPIIRSGGAVTGAVTVTRDVTELVEAKQRYRTLFDTIPEGLYETVARWLAPGGQRTAGTDPRLRRRCVAVGECRQCDRLVASSRGAESPAQKDRPWNDIGDGRHRVHSS